MAEVWKLPAAHGPSCWWPSLWSAVYLPPHARQWEAWSCPSPAATAKQPIRTLDDWWAAVKSPTSQDWNLRTPPQGGSVVSLITRRGAFRPQMMSVIMDSVVFLPGMMSHFSRDLRPYKRHSSLLALNAIYCRMHWTWHWLLCLFPCTIILLRKSLVLGLFHHIFWRVAQHLLISLRVWDPAEGRKREGMT